MSKRSIEVLPDANEKRTTTASLFVLVGKDLNLDSVTSPSRSELVLINRDIGKNPEKNAQVYKFAVSIHRDLFEFEYQFRTELYGPAYPEQSLTLY